MISTRSIADRHQPPHILVVDNERSLTAAISDVLAEDGYRVSVAHDAEAALNVALQDAPMLVLTDIMMPGMDGLTFVQRLREEASLRYVGVLFFSAADAARRARQLGAGFIRKPAPRDELLQAVFNGISIVFGRREREPMPAIDGW